MSVPEVVANTPVEIWREIIEWVLFDPIIFLDDPFFPGCNLHTALNDWTDSRRLRKHEIQRGRLRLVSQAWKTLADSSSYRYFEPYSCNHVDLRVKQTQSAHRVEHYHRCGPPVLGSRVESCVGCEYCTDTGIKDVLLYYRPVSAKILRLPLWKQSQIYLNNPQKIFDNDFPNLRALFISVDAHSLDTVSKLFVNLTFLSLRKEAAYFPENHPPLALAKLKTFQFQITDNGDITFLKRWSMPSLAHIDLIVEIPRIDLSDICTLFLDIGHTAQSLRISSEMGFLPFPADIWEKMPLLEYLALSTMERLDDSLLLVRPGPPPDHPFHTFAILYDEGYMYRVRNDTRRVVEKWKGLSTIADSHSWENMPKGISEDWEEGAQVTRGLGVTNDSDWEDVALLQLLCTQYGLRYEDCSGRTFAEFQAVHT